MSVAAMKPSRSQLLLAILSSATIAIGVLVLSLAPEKEESAEAPDAAAAAAARPDEGLGGRLLHALRGGPTELRESEEAAPPPPPEPIAAIPPEVLGPVEAPQPVDAPTPPPRPEGLGEEEIPLPPRRPSTLLGEASAEKPETQAAAPQAAAAPTEQQVAALAPEPTLRPAPPGAFDRPDQPPPRFNMGAPAYVRIFKKEGELELWLKVSGHYTLYRTFPICKWSGHLGPKLKEADYQSPEGFYAVSSKQLNPHSNYYRAFNVGYPNAFDKQNGRTGGLVMVHGACKSVGCFAMTDKGVEEIYGFVSAALSAGQREVPVHIFPFRMTDAALQKETTTSGWMSFMSQDAEAGKEWVDFWKNLKEGYDRFEASHEPPTAYACGDHYAFEAGKDGCQKIAGW
ncbi:MAG TPA: L,D-transpeptidase family protein [Methylocystis sp.]|nr:L,D-transpeptidase family protein [Methylocystis sp.]